MTSATRWLGWLLAAAAWGCGSEPGGAPSPVAGGFAGAAGDDADMADDGDGAATTEASAGHDSAANDATPSDSASSDGDGSMDAGQDAVANDAATPTNGWSLVWSDEFDGTGLPDESKWGYDVGGHGWGNGESQFYTDHRWENARVENGTLVIEARKEPYEGKDYTSVRLVSREKGDWLYGRFEARARLPGGRGTWPAIWMLPTDWVYGGWPASGEIDIMEHVGFDPGVIHGTVHTQAYHHSIGTQKGGATQVPDATSEFHLYAVEWTPEQVDFFVDDTHYYGFANEHGDFTVWPFDQRFHLILNVAVGGSWGGAQGIDDGVFPQQMVVDYVRVYEHD